MSMRKILSGLLENAVLLPSNCLLKLLESNMASRVSEQLLDAYMVGDQEAIASLQETIREKTAAVQAKPSSNKFSIPTLLNDDHSSAINVYEFLNGAFGPDWWEWEIETIDHMLFTDYGVVLEEVNKDKVLAIRHACRSDGPFFDWYEFNQVGLAFAGAIADFEMLRSPSPGMIINAARVLVHIRPDREAFFGNDVLKYICINLYEAGIYAPPPSLVDMISETMKKFVTASMFGKWPQIFAKVEEIKKDTSTSLEETDIDIQATRIVNAEAAALAYNK